jgi:hypothetical protein
MILFAKIKPGCPHYFAEITSLDNVRLSIVRRRLIWMLGFVVTLISFYNIWLYKREVT